MTDQSRPEGLTDPGPLPTTLTRQVVEQVWQDMPAHAALRALRHRLEEMRTAVIAANQLAKMVGELPRTEREVHANVPGLAEAANRWQDRYGYLAEPPLAVEVEDDDEDDSHEDALSVREEQHTTRVYLRTDGTPEHEIGTIGDPEELPVLLHLAADEMAKPSAG